MKLGFNLCLLTSKPTGFLCHRIAYDHVFWEESRRKATHRHWTRLLLPEVGVSCSEILHPPEGSADELNQKEFIPGLFPRSPPYSPLYRAARSLRPESLFRSFKRVCTQKRYEQAMGHLSKVKNRTEEQREVSGTGGEETGVKGIVDDTTRQNDSGRGMGALGEGLGRGLDW